VSSSAKRRFRFGLDIETQSGFSVALVRTMTGVASIGQNWPDIPIELDLGSRRRDSHRKQREAGSLQTSGHTDTSILSSTLHGGDILNQAREMHGKAVRFRHCPATVIGNASGSYGHYPETGGKTV
jgi:hypothetical protein